MLAQLKTQQTNLVLQRSQAKDVVEQTERALGQLNSAIQALEADAKAREEAAAKEAAVQEETNED